MNVEIPDMDINSDDYLNFLLNSIKNDNDDLSDIEDEENEELVLSDSYEDDEDDDESIPSKGEINRMSRDELLELVEEEGLDVDDPDTLELADLKESIIEELYWIEEEETDLNESFIKTTIEHPLQRNSYEESDDLEGIDDDEEEEDLENEMVVKNLLSEMQNISDADSSVKAEEVARDLVSVIPFNFLTKRYVACLVLTEDFRTENEHRRRSVKVHKERELQSSPEYKSTINKSFINMLKHQYDAVFHYREGGRMKLVAFGDIASKDGEDPNSEYNIDAKIKDLLDRFSHDLLELLDKRSSN